MIAALLVAGVLALVLAVQPVAAAPVGAPALLDGFEDASRWRAVPADGVTMTLDSDAGARGRSLRLDFDFGRGGGWAVVRRELDLELPEHYAFSFHVRGRCRPNHLEFKLIDGDDVWWSVQRDYEFPAEWTKLTIRRRQIRFAWGPRGGGEPKRVRAIELAITAGEGGSGSVWIDELELVPLPPPPATPAVPSARASSALPGSPPTAVLDTLPHTVWRSRPARGPAWLAVDLGQARELSGLVLDWDSQDYARRYLVQGSLDGARWDTLRRVEGGDGGRDWLWLPETEVRHLRLTLLQSAGGRRAFALRGLEPKPPEWAPTRADFFQRNAADAPRGSYPRGLTGEQVYWAVLGDPRGDYDEALLSEDGALEIARGGISIEPFVRLGDALMTWADVETEHGLEPGSPKPWARWRHSDFDLRVSALAASAGDTSRFLARYQIANPGAEPLDATLVLALRPFQVNPPSQSLNLAGDVSRLGALHVHDSVACVDGRARVLFGKASDASGATTFDGGDITTFLRAGRWPEGTQVSDPFAAASGAVAFELHVPPRDSIAIDAVILARVAPRCEAAAAHAPGELARSAALEADVRARWRQRLGRFELRLPGAGADLAATVRSNLAWILIHRDGWAIQPGSRSYERAWIRDGALTSTALLRLGQDDVARGFLEWFAGHQYPNGKVPCCVDRRGADPVPEHDSHGELIYLVAETWRHTGDRALLERMWPHVAAAAAHLDSLRRTRRTSEYERPESRHFYGLLPPSISHEGYSAKPMHSYWDDLFALRGFKDAVVIAEALGRADDARRLTAIRDEFRRDLVTSLERALAYHRIHYLPGCADLGDFDPTSTTIALSPVDERAHLPQKALVNTFERYWEFFAARRDSTWDAYTPYELRNVGAFVRLGWRERAHELLEWFLGHRRPRGWQQWAEVVGRDPRAPRFIGDMPHGWVGSDFIRSVLDLVAYEREADSALVVGAGVPERWLAAGDTLEVRGLSTHYGTLELSMARHRKDLRVRIGGGLRVPRGGIVVRSPLAGQTRRVRINGKGARARDEVVVRRLPAVVDFR